MTKKTSPNKQFDASYGICLLSVVPIRAKPADPSEMTTQLLFGETFCVLEQTPHWLKIKIDTDQYEGWLDKKQATSLSQKQHTELLNTPKNYSLDLISSITQNTSTIPLVIGSTIPNIQDNQFIIKDLQFQYNGNVSKEKNVSKPVLLVQNALKYLHAPYLWGGRSPFGIDCSGFTQIVYKTVHISLLRDASQQATQGTMVPSIQSVTTGDLAFFGKTKDGNITHVGLILDSNRIIHASGKVRIDTIDQTGIFNQDEQKYTHQLHFVKRIIL